MNLQYPPLFNISLTTGFSLSTTKYSNSILESTINLLAKDTTQNIFFLLNHPQLVPVAFIKFEKKKKSLNKEWLLSKMRKKS